MAISVRDIQEKEFGTQSAGGYNIEQVDDFLDEISEQMAALVRENLELNRQIKALEADVQADQITVGAKEKADALLSKAQQEADDLTAEVKGRVETLEARYEALKASAAAYKEEFTRLMDQQANALRESNGLF